MHTHTYVLTSGQTARLTATCMHAYMQTDACLHLACTSLHLACTSLHLACTSLHTLYFTASCMYFTASHPAVHCAHTRAPYAFPVFCTTALFQCTHCTSLHAPWFVLHTVFHCTHCTSLHAPWFVLHALYRSSPNAKNPRDLDIRIEYDFKGKMGEYCRTQQYKMR